MHDQTLTIPQHADPIARGLLLGLLAALLGLAVVAPAPPTEASAPIVIIATPALAALPLSARLDAPTSALPTTVPTAPPRAEPPSEAAIEAVAAPTIAPPPDPPAPTSAPPTSEQSANIAPAAPPQADTAAPLVAQGPQVPEGPQQIHQQPDSTYITVGDSPLRYYVDAEGQVTEVRLPGVDTAPNGADLAAQAPATAQPSAVPAPAPASKGRGYLPRAAYRPVRP